MAKVARTAGPRLVSLAARVNHEFSRVVARDLPALALGPVKLSDISAQLFTERQAQRPSAQASACSRRRFFRGGLLRRRESVL